MPSLTNRLRNKFKKGKLIYLEILKYYKNSTNGFYKIERAYEDINIDDNKLKLLLDNVTISDFKRTGCKEKWQYEFIGNKLVEIVGISVTQDDTNKIVKRMIVKLES